MCDQRVWQDIKKKHGDSEKIEKRLYFASMNVSQPINGRFCDETETMPYNNDRSTRVHVLIIAPTEQHQLQLQQTLEAKVETNFKI